MIVKLVQSACIQKTCWCCIHFYFHFCCFYTIFHYRCVYTIFGVEQKSINCRLTKWIFLLEPILHSGRGGGGRGRGEGATYIPPKIKNKKLVTPLDFLTTPSTPSKEPENYWESLLWVDKLNLNAYILEIRF